MLKSTFNGLQRRRRQYVSICILFAVLLLSPESANSREILRKFELRYIEMMTHFARK